MNITELDKDVAFTIKYAMEKRLEAKQLEDSADALKKEADEVLLPLLATLDDMKVVDEDMGTVSVVTQNRPSFDQTIAKETLLNNGVPSEVIALTWQTSTKVTPSTSVRYTRPKVKA
ncbi:MAG: hypothetical protein WC713_06740 [Candidatus Methylomirabilota bacterium]|jgi:hypothetical protein